MPHYLIGRRSQKLCCNMQKYYHLMTNMCLISSGAGAVIADIERCALYAAVQLPKAACPPYTLLFLIFQESPYRIRISFTVL